MGKATALNAPVIVYGGRTPPGAGGSSDVDAAPSLFYGGVALMDSRQAYNYGRAGAVGFSAASGLLVLNAVPSTLSATSIAAAQVPAAGVALTLVSVTGGGITVNAAATGFTFPSGNVIPAGALYIDGAPAIIGEGLDGFTGLWNVSTLIQRAVRITSVGNDSGATVTVAGFDYGGYPVTQTLTMANAGSVVTTKTFKGIYSVTCTGTLSGANVSVGHADVYGFPLAATYFEQLNIFWSGAFVTANTGWLTADTTSPATTASGDTRGTYAVQSASNGVKRLVLYVTPTVSGTTLPNMNQGVWGVPSV